MRLAAASESIAEENESPSKPLALLSFVLNFAVARMRFGRGAAELDVGSHRRPRRAGIGTGRRFPVDL
jgi:hypothetical protein